VEEAWPIDFILQTCSSRSAWLSLFHYDTRNRGQRRASTQAHIMSTSNAQAASSIQICR